MTYSSGVKTVAELMAMAAITAPKTRGENFVQVMIVEGEKVKELGRAMVTYGAMFHKKNFDRDGQNVEASEAVVLIGLKDAAVSSLDCGACGFGSCAEFEGQTPVDLEFRGPTCAYRLLDLGIALGSAVKVASLLNVDNRIMYRIGAVARHLRWVDWDFVLGIPLSVTGKSPYFDRG